MMNRRFLGRAVASLAAVWALAGTGAVHAADEAPDVMVQRLSTEVLDALRADKSVKAGDLDKVIVLVDKTIMPNVNFRRMTAAAVGPGWRKASPEQQKRLQDEFKTLLVRTYAGALAQVSDQTINVKPLRASPVCPRDQRQRHRRPDRRPGGTQPEQRQGLMAWTWCWHCLLNSRTARPVPCSARCCRGCARTRHRTG